MTRPLPPHGSEARYRGTTTRPACRCRCRTCITGWTRACKRRELARRRGRPPTTPAAQVTTHLQFLLARGMTTGQIAATADVGGNTVYDHARGNLSRIRHSTAQKILATRPGQDSDYGYAPALGSIRRVRALYAAGYGATLIADAAGMAVSAISTIADGNRTTVSTRTRDAVITAYQQLAARPGTSARARNRAARNRWAGPGYWDDEDFDNPDFTPASEDTTSAHQRARETAAEVQHLASFGIPASEIATRVGHAPSYVREQLAGRRAPGWRTREKTLAA